MTDKIKGAYDHLKTKNTSPSPEKGTTPGIMKLFMTTIIIFGLLTGLGVFTGNTPFFFDNTSNDGGTDTGTNTGTYEGLQISADLYSSPTCGCCHDYVDILSNLGFDIEHHKTIQYNDVKDENRVPMDKRSCHTMIVGQYFVEGHIPSNVIIDLLDSNQQIDGIALAGMPSGSPGMSGEKSGTWDIYAIENGEAIGIFQSI